MFFLWHVGLVDTFSLLQFCVNAASQYGAIVAASAAGNFYQIGLKVLLEPIIGFSTSYQFIRAAQTAAERRARLPSRQSLQLEHHRPVRVADLARERRRRFGIVGKQTERLQVGVEAALADHHPVRVEGDAPGARSRPAARRTHPVRVW